MGVSARDGEGIRGGERRETVDGHRRMDTKMEKRVRMDWSDTMYVTGGGSSIVCVC